jgi:hypothetical protein
VFDVNLATHWGALGIIMLVTLALTLIVQKRKDVI